MTRFALLIALAIAPACATAKPKPPAPVAAPAPLPEFADGADAAKVLDAKVATETARLRWMSALEEFERKYHIKSANGEGWDEVASSGGPCTPNDCRLRLRRAPPAPLAPKQPAPAPKK